MRQVSRPHISLTAGISSAVCPPRPSPLPAKPENAPLRVDFLEEETGTHYLKISGSMLGLLNTFWRSTCSCKMLQNVTDLYNIYIYKSLQIYGHFERSCLNQGIKLSNTELRRDMARKNHYACLSCLLVLPIHETCNKCIQIITNPS
jgi:hypothetical protein